MGIAKYVRDAAVTAAPLPAIGPGDPAWELLRSLYDTPGIPGETRTPPAEQMRKLGLPEDTPAREANAEINRIWLKEFATPPRTETGEAG